MGRPKVDIAIRFNNKINKTKTCWLWTGCLHPNGYGVMKGEGRNEQAHRVAYKLFVGEIPAGLVLDHLCRVRNCVNPEHLEVVTVAENSSRGNRTNKGKFNASKTHCPQGHAYTIANTYYEKAPRRRRCRTCRERQRGFVSRGNETVQDKSGNPV